MITVNNSTAALAVSSHSHLSSPAISRFSLISISLSLPSYVSLAHTYFLSLWTAVICPLANGTLSCQLSKSHTGRRQNGSAHTHVQTHTASSSRGSKKGERQKYHLVMWINDPISQLEVYGLLFPNCRSLKSVGILIAETYPPPLSPADRGKTGKRRRLE